MTWLNPLDEAHFAVSTIQASSRSKVNLIRNTTTVQKLDVPGPDEKFCLCWLCALTKFSSGGAIFPVHLIFERL